MSRYPVGGFDPDQLIDLQVYDPDHGIRQLSGRLRIDTEVPHVEVAGPDLMLEVTGVDGLEVQDSFDYTLNGDGEQRRLALAESADGVDPERGSLSVDGRRGPGGLPQVFIPTEPDAHRAITATVAQQLAQEEYGLLTGGTFPAGPDTEPVATGYRFDMITSPEVAEQIARDHGLDQLDPLGAVAEPPKDLQISQEGLADLAQQMGTYDLSVADSMADHIPAGSRLMIEKTLTDRIARESIPDPDTGLALDPTDHDQMARYLLVAPELTSQDYTATFGPHYAGVARALDGISIDGGDSEYDSFDDQALTPLHELAYTVIDRRGDLGSESIAHRLRDYDRVDFAGYAPGTEVDGQALPDIYPEEMRRELLEAGMLSGFESRTDQLTDVMLEIYDDPERSRQASNAMAAAGELINEHLPMSQSYSARIAGPELAAAVATVTARDKVDSKLYQDMTESVRAVTGELLPGDHDPMLTFSARADKTRQTELARDRAAEEQWIADNPDKIGDQNPPGRKISDVIAAAAERAAEAGEDFSGPDYAPF